MAYSSSLSTLTLLLFFLHQPFFSEPKPLTRFNAKRLKPQFSNPTHAIGDGPTEFFEVKKPIELPDTEPCSHRLLTRDFGFTYGGPPALSTYTPPSHCRSPRFSKIVLQWRATCRGTQFDRIFGVWLAGVELLRGCTAEPTSSGIVWTVEKDVTRYHSLLVKNETQTLAVYLGNIVDSTYTGVYHVNLTLHFYPAGEENPTDREPSLASGFRSWADLVLPISRDLPLKDGQWFEISNSVGTQLKEFNIPRNAYRAVLEVYVSFHEKDEFWYSNLPNDYIAENDLTDVPGNGPFREVVVSLNGDIVGAVWPFPVIFTGGFNPLFWRPVSGIGSFDLPTYDIEITPLLGLILDGSTHTLAFTVTNASNVWLVDANLHLWLDRHWPETQGEVLSRAVGTLIMTRDSEFSGLDGRFWTTASRRVSSAGSVRSSFGNFVTRSVQEFSYSNSMRLENDGNTQTVDQTIRSNDTVRVGSRFFDVFAAGSERAFPLHLYTDFAAQSDGESYLIVTNLTSGFDEEKWARVIGVELGKSSVRNEQSGFGYLVVRSEGTSASASTKQVYDYEGENSCYFRNISSKNYVIDYDYVNNLCTKNVQLPVNQGFSSV